jgi:hypothetical protein
MPLLNIDNLETPWTPASEEDFTKVRRQLERILEDPHFKGSKRYTRFLRFIVEEALSGNSGGIKERSLGIAVFDRPLDYDTYSDSIVRVAASEVRKRIAQYYDTPVHDHELRIGLPSGSYTPEFRLGRPTLLAQRRSMQIMAWELSNQDWRPGRRSYRRKVNLKVEDSSIAEPRFTC